MANAFTDAFKEAFRRTKQDFISGVLGKEARTGPSPDSVQVGKEGGSTLADLMYAFARGGKDQLIEKVTAKFRASRTGMRVEQEAKTQAIQDVLRNPAFIVPVLVVAVILILIVGRLTR